MNVPKQAQYRPLTSGREQYLPLTSTSLLLGRVYPTAGTSAVDSIWTDIVAFGKALLLEIGLQAAIRQVN